MLAECPLRSLKEFASCRRIASASGGGKGGRDQVRLGERLCPGEIWHVTYRCGQPYQLSLPKQWLGSALQQHCKQQSKQQ